jgi:hypothetical protein
MTAHRALNIALTGATAVGIAAILLAGPVLDDKSAEWQQSSALADAQRAAREARQAERDAIRQCTALHGPGAAVGYGIDGNVICGPRRGAGAQVVASKGGAL